jgi:hypothetical protein
MFFVLLRESRFLLAGGGFWSTCAVGIGLSWLVVMIEVESENGRMSFLKFFF